MTQVMVASETKGAMSTVAVVRIVKMALCAIGTTKRDGEISIAFIGPKRMREINRMYHGEDRVTDVLAFSELESQKARKPESQKARKPYKIRKSDGSPALQLSSSPALQLGEILICPTYVRAQAKRAGEPFRREVSRVLIHGVLHLVGYDHTTPKEAKRMFGLQEQIVKTLKSKP